MIRELEEQMSAPWRLTSSARRSRATMSVCVRCWSAMRSLDDGSDADVFSLARDDLDAAGPRFPCARRTHLGHARLRIERVDGADDARS